MSTQEETGTRPAGSSANTGTPQTLDPWFLELLACPVCETHPALTLDAARNTLTCANGLHVFPIRDGIPILLAEEATASEPDAETTALSKK